MAENLLSPPDDMEIYDTGDFKNHTRIAFREMIRIMGEWSRRSDHRLPLPRERTNELIEQFFSQLHTWPDGPLLLEYISEAPDAFLPLALCGCFDDELGIRLINGDDDDVDDDELEFRRKLYLTLIDACEQRGLFELGNALLAFFIRSQYHATRTIPLDHVVDSTLLNKARSWPGWVLVTQEIAVVVDTDRESQTLNHLWLRAYLGNPENDRPQAQVSLSNQGAQNILMRRLGKEEWLALQPSTKERLIESEITWDRFRHDLGTGKRHWQGVPMELFTAVEGEVISRMTPLFNSSEWTDYQRQKSNCPDKPTLGAIMYIFKSRQGVPPHLKKMSGELCPFMTQENHRSGFEELVKLRNKAAHAQHPPFDENDFLRVRQILYKEGLLKAMISR